MRIALRLLPALLALFLGTLAAATTTITPSTHEVGAGTVPYQILVDSDADWTATTPANWVTLSRASGSQEGNIVVTAAANTTGADRTATILVNGVPHTLTQRSGSATLQELWAFGNDSNGQLGDNNAPHFQRSSPGLILDSGVRSVAAGEGHTLIVKTDGSLWAMGANYGGQLGDGTTTDRTSPVLILVSGVQSVAAGVHHSLIVKTDGSLWTMGSNRDGQLGDGTWTNRSSPVLILANSARSVAVGGSRIAIDSWPLAGEEDPYRSLIVKTDGSLWATGEPGYSSEFAQIFPSAVQSVSEGNGYALIIKTDGSLWKISATAQTQILASGVRSVSSGPRESLIVKTDGSLWALVIKTGITSWPTSEYLVPILADGVQSATTVGSDEQPNWRGSTTYRSDALIVKTDGSLWAMGSNHYGQLGDGTRTERTLPVQILAGGVQTVSMGMKHSLIVKTDGSLWGMGDNTYGQLGGGARIDRPSPLQIQAGEIQSLATGDAHSLVLKTDGSLWATGLNDHGQLGDGTTTNRARPTLIAASGVGSISAGSKYSLIVKTDGSLWAMGSNNYGQLGDGTTTDRTSPSLILASGVQSAAAGYRHSLIVKTDGSLWAMGSNEYGQLGDGTKTDRTSPVQILFSGAQSAAAGGSQSLIVKTDGSLWAMGASLAGGGYYDQETPMQIIASGVQSVSASGHNLIVKTDGSLWAMGDNYHGRLGDGTTEVRKSPVRILSGCVRSAAAGGDHSLILKTDGSLWAMGYNNYGQLGDGTKDDRHVPVLLAHNVQMVAAGGTHSLVVASGSIAPTGQVVRIQPTSKTVEESDDATLTVESFASPEIQWFRDGRAIANGTSSTLTLREVTPADAGIYEAVLSVGTTRTLSQPAVIGVTPNYERTAGSVTTRPEWQDIHHPNGAIYDQYLLTGAVGTFSTANIYGYWPKIARCSFLDEDDSIVQVEMSGPGAITIKLDNPTGPMAAARYNQPGIEYMKGKATIILAGATEKTHFTIYSVGTANNPGVTRPGVVYAGWANVAVVGIVSTNGGLGGIHQGNVSFNAATGYTGIVAPNANSVGELVVVHNITASALAQPYLFFGPGCTTVKIAGSSLAQPNGDGISVSGLSQVQMGAGQDSCGRPAPAQTIQTRLFDVDDVDVTAGLLIGP
ncbi:MAG: immunoglobulin domain-containing protein [Opitutaceae bacterium]|nr:immunoglobulin domain-containing protein [Opitutaceae bacterium]